MVRELEKKVFDYHIFPEFPLVLFSVFSFEVFFSTEFFIDKREKGKSIEIYKM